MQRFCTYEHRDTGFDVECMTEDQFNTGGKARVGEADCYVWQFAEDEETAIRNHVSKHEEWEADIAAGRQEKSTY